MRSDRPENNATYNETEVLWKYIQQHLVALLPQAEIGVRFAEIGRVQVTALYDPVDLSHTVIRRWGRYHDSHVENAFEDLFEYKQQMIARVLALNPEGVINRCPKCNRVARTPQARQCRWCHHHWHK